MTIPHSVAIVPGQPKQDSYGFSELALFKTFTRDSFRSAFGSEAPPYDPTRLIKTWFDSSADTSDPANVVLYADSGEGEQSFQRERERHSGPKANSSRSVATLAV